MALHDDLLKQARHLADMDRRRPKQASLRRAVSSAYYAIFHALIDDASRFLLRGAARESLRNQLARAFEHGHMKQAARAFAYSGKKRNAPKNEWRLLLSATPSADLRNVADTFVDLQQWRHDADYNVARAFTRSEVQAVVTRATAALALWRTLRGSREAEIFCLALLVRSRS